ncbi:uncharacterized protein BP01DRAFT_386021 [Aspergillus saccharolyticus JOP 1030-1]|uniref:MIT domain-containing protein n=1 Tax=Aspergillus saccharolyticus JOP 1030-1 TaxID=1450539 RepID=A0A318ZAZ2_9EURO|nr:hypothetical protein BP01DRAFT_386021 [Aspergillus saccharolyticus JOP 1030-1]PYH41883.1 hypothetical protein BP01DRAFT_386021 [Aspergillus saccharolyticus JOP 1030-1]
MLSKALQKANTAVLLDNAANFEGAMEAYNDACQLLQLVMDRSDGGEDEKLKLREIRDTYMIRINELQCMDFSIRNVDSKALPERPRSEESYIEYSSVQNNEAGSLSGEGSNRSQRGSDAQSVFEMTTTVPSGQTSLHQLSLLPSAITEDKFRTASVGDWTKRALGLEEHNIQSPCQPFNEYVRDPATTKYELTQEPISEPRSVDASSSGMPLLNPHAKGVHETTSWLDTIDESGASSPASVHSNSSSLYLRHRGAHESMVGTEAEFDAAMDAAVEAAYDDSLELTPEPNYDGVVEHPRAVIKPLKQPVTEFGREGEIVPSQNPLGTFDERNLRRSSGHEIGYLDDDAEEEERLLEEMTRGYVMDEFEFGILSKSALPRQQALSDQPTRSQESMALAATHGELDATLYTPLNATNTDARTSSQSKGSLLIPTTKSMLSPLVGSGVRARRLSGQRNTELKIETKSHLDTRLVTSIVRSPDTFVFRPGMDHQDEHQLSVGNGSNKNSSSASGVRSLVQSKRRNVSVGSFTEDILAHGTCRRNQDIDKAWHTKPPSPTRPIGKVASAPDGLDKSHDGLGPSSMRNISVLGTEMPSESPNTPLNNVSHMSEAQKAPITASLPMLPTPTGTNIGANGSPSRGLNLFDTHIHSPTSPGSPNVMAADPPLPLEPCPESFLLRPFWLMRCIYQTMAHPRGGYLSTKLFVPRDVWRVKNVKIKAVEEKVSSCDLLTAALLKLAQVDTYDADAILEEMQSLESVLDQVQILLSKKVGSEVGVHGAMTLLKSNQAFDDTLNNDISFSKPSPGPSKSYLTSWRKLRSKNAGFAVAAAACSKESSRDFSTSNSVPMTSVPSQHTKRNFSQLQLNGGSNYMGALARLCDAVQVLDQIAQQVEDPGLKHSSPTLVGLELSTRHAAEFFGFYICRFALNDIGLMLDKFIKRGSEWVLI